MNRYDFDSSGDGELEYLNGNKLSSTFEYEKVTIDRKQDENWRCKLLWVPLIGLALVFAVASKQTYKHFRVERTYADEASYLATDLVGNEFLFDFTTLQGALEKTSVLGDPTYDGSYHKLNEIAAYWKTVAADPEFADGTNMVPFWNETGYISPWLENEAHEGARKIEQLYETPADAPHIVFFVVDDWGSNDPGYQSNYMSWTTPNIDRLANSGIKLKEYYSHEWCAPSRAALMTGRYALRFGMHAIPDDSNLDLVEVPNSEVTIAEEMKSAGYRTYLIGKWHLGWSKMSKTPSQRGFDYFYGYLGGLIDYFTKEYNGFIDLHENDHVVEDENDLDANLHTAYLFANKAEAVIADHATNHKDEPMFLYYGSQLLHNAWQLPSNYSDQCSVFNASALQDDYTMYCGMNLLLDEVVSNLTCALEKYNMMKDTLFILASDNGGWMHMEGNNFPYRASKGSVFRGAQSVPAFITGPSSIIPNVARGTSYYGMMHVTDWLPTLMTVATGGKWKGSMSGAELDGMDMMSAIIKGKDSPRVGIVHYADQLGNISLQHEQMKLVRTHLRILTGTTVKQEFWGTSPNINMCNA